MDMFKLFQIIQLILGALMWTLIGQGILALMLGQKRSTNFIYRFFGQITRPVFKLTRLLSPKFIADTHIGFLAFLLLILLRLAVYMFFSYNGWIPSITVPTAS